MSKIIICGLNGSGKTTLGKELSKKINYIHKDIETYYFKNENDYKYVSARTREEVTRELEKDFDKYENIVFTACKGDYGNLNDLYDFAIFIQLDKETRLNRVKERSYKQFGNRILKNGDLYEKENDFFNMVYNKEESVITEWFKNLKCSKIEIDGKNTIEENLRIILNNYQNIL
ncbi:MAG: AAA family ATPase [Clostridia bacterium]|nr:AAA family ATPase [Clostridia bacterium]